MGAALLSTPDLLLDILRKLVANIPLPISCKIRLLPDQPPTLHLVARILRTGIRNLTVHCRTRDMRPREPALWDRLSEIVALGKARKVSIICNGDGKGWANWDSIRELTGADSVMLARAAESNPSVFSSAGMQCNITEVVPKHLKLCHYIGNPWGNTRFLLNQFRPSPAPTSRLNKQQKKEAQEAVTRSKSVEEVADKLGIDVTGGRDLLDEIQKRLAQSQ